MAESINRSQLLARVAGNGDINEVVAAAWGNAVQQGLAHYDGKTIAIPKEQAARVFGVMLGVVVALAWPAEIKDWADDFKADVLRGQIADVLRAGGN